MEIWSLLSAVVVGVSSWTPADVSQFWVEPDVPATFSFNAVPTTEHSEVNVENFNGSDKIAGENDVAENTTIAEAFVVRTTDGNVFAEGRGVRDGERLRVETTIPQGFFELEFPATGQSFGVASQPSFCLNPEASEGENGERVRDPFFGIDAAATWLVGSDSARDDLIRNARRIGIATIRERTNWSRLEPTEGEFNFNGDGNADVLRQAALKYKTPILELFHNAPDWTGRIGERYPNDLMKLATSWTKIAERWAPTWNSIEIWNEPDISFGGNLPGDQYVPILQSVSQEYLRQGVKTPVVGGVVATFRDDWMDCAAENGILDACDIFSFHTYCRAPEMAGICLRYLTWLDKNGALGKPVWITECGRPWKKGTDRPNREADLESAIDIAQKGVVAKALGIDAYFPFVYPFYEENDNNFGMSDRNNAPLRSIAGYAQTIRILSDKRAVGALTLKDGESCEKLAASFVFSDINKTGKDRVAVLYAKNREAGRTLKITEFAPLFVERITGEKLKLTAEGTVDFSDGFLFVGIPDDATLMFSNDSVVDSTRIRRENARNGGALKKRRAPSTVVRFDFDEQKLSAGNGGYKIIDAQAKTFDGSLTVFNFDDAPRTFAVSCVASLDGEGKNVATFPQTLDVPARGKAILPFTLNAEEISPLASMKLRFEFFDSSDKNRKTPVGLVAFSLLKEVSAEGFAKFAAEKTSVDLSANDRWRPSCAACGTMKFKEAAALGDGYSWGFDATFGEGDHWVYPVLPIDFDCSAFTGVAFRIKATSDDPTSTLRFFVYNEAAQCYYYTGAGFAAADGKERLIILPFSALGAYGGTPDPFDAKRIRFFSIGGNTPGKKLSVEVGDFFFFK